MLRSVGALIFGMISDRYGRKWPMIACLCLFIVLELATGFTQNLHQFLAVRSLYGIAMGGKLPPLFSNPMNNPTNKHIFRSLRSRSRNRTRRPPLRSSRHPLWPLRARLRNRLPPRRTLLPRLSPHHFPRLAKPLLVWRRPTSVNNHISTLSP
jgi:hypothetical protein